MIYGSIVRVKIRQTFDHVNNHRWDEAVKALAPNVHHRVSGDHALGSERHDKNSVRLGSSVSVTFYRICTSRFPM